MAIALHLPESSRATGSVSSGRVHTAVAGFKRLGWHIRAYGIILGIMLLTFLSLVVLQFHWVFRGFSLILQRKAPSSLSTPS